MTNPALRLLTLLLSLSLLSSAAAQKGYAVQDTIPFRDIKRSCVPGIGSFLRLVLDAPIRGKKPPIRYCKLYENGEFIGLHEDFSAQRVFESVQQVRWFDKTARSIYAVETLYYCPDTTTRCDTVFLNILFRDGGGSLFQKREFEEDVAYLTEGLPKDPAKPLRFPKHKYRAWVTDHNGEQWVGRFAAANDRSLFLSVDQDEWNEEVLEIPLDSIYSIGTYRKGAPAVGIVAGILGATLIGGVTASTGTGSTAVGALAIGALAAGPYLGFKKRWYRVEADRIRFRIWCTRMCRAD